MRKIALVISGLLFFAAAFVSCFDEKDFAFDKFTYSDLAPTLHIPLVNDTLRLDVGSDYNVHYDEQTGVGYLEFEIENNSIIPPAGDFFRVNDTSYTIKNIVFNNPFPVDLEEPVDMTPQSYTVNFPFSGGDRQIDSITFKTGALTFSSLSGGTYTVKIPGLKKNGASFSATISGTTTHHSLSGYTLRMGADNAFSADVGLRIQFFGPSYTFSPTMTFSDMEIAEVYGYFGQPEVEAIKVPGIDVSVFDEFRYGDNTTLRIKEAFLEFHVENGAGFPLMLKIQEIKSIHDNGEDIVKNVDSVIIAARKRPEDDPSSGDYKIGGRVFGDVLNGMPSKVDFEFFTMINPEGDGGGTVTNFLTDNDNMVKVSNIKARIPLEFSVKGLLLRDTLDFNTSNVTFNDMELLVNVENHIPVEISMQAYLLDGNGYRIEPLFKKEISIKASTNEPNIKVEANVEKLAQAKKIDVEIRINTSGSDFVSLKKDAYVHLRIGAKSSINISNLDTN